jgi:DNA-binding transcriptional regulator YiaG
MSKSKAAKAQTFVLSGREKCQEPLHYTACGLDNIYLANGFTRRTTSYGSGVSVDNVEALHMAIGRHLIHKSGPLSRAEFKFLRNHLGLTQGELAAKLFTEEQNVGRWERGGASIPGPADKLLRTLFYVVTCSEEELQAFMDEIERLMEKTSSGDKSLNRQVFFKSNKSWDEVRVS